MYCSVVKNLIGGSSGIEDGAVKTEGYHWDRKPYVSCLGRKKKIGGAVRGFDAEEVIILGEDGIEFERIWGPFPDR